MADVYILPRLFLVIDNRKLNKEGWWNKLKGRYGMKGTISYSRHFCGTRNIEEL